jgi:tetratricopeptide (TPR) repeat protein
MLFKKESVINLKSPQSLYDADKLTEAAISYEEEGLADEAVKYYAKALDIHNALFTGPERGKVNDNPEFHEDFATLYYNLSKYFDNDVLILDGAIFHYGEATRLYEQNGESELSTEMQQNKNYVHNLRNGQIEIDENEEVIGDDQPTEEIPIITDEQLKEYDQAKKGQEREKKLSPRKMASVVMSKLVKKSNS